MQSRNNHTDNFQRTITQTLSNQSHTRYKNIFIDSNLHSNSGKKNVYQNERAGCSCIKKCWFVFDEKIAEFSMNKKRLC